MKTIKSIVLSTLGLICFASVVMMFILVCATDVSDIGKFAKLFLGTILALAGSSYALKVLTERWSK